MSREKISTDEVPKTHYSLVDDGTIEKLRQYYNIKDEGEILRFVKKHGGSMRLKVDGKPEPTRVDTGPP